MVLKLDDPAEPSPEPDPLAGSMARARRLARSRKVGADVGDHEVPSVGPERAQAQFALAEALLRSDDPDVIFFIRCMYYSAAGLFSPDEHGSARAVFDTRATMAMLRREPTRFRVWQACFDAFESTCLLGPVLRSAGLLGDRVYGPQLVERIHQHRTARALALHAVMNSTPDPLEGEGPALAIALGYVVAQRIAAAGGPMTVCRPSHHGDLQAVLDADPALAARVSALDAQPLMRCLFQDAILHWLHVEQLNAVAVDPEPPE